MHQETPLDKHSFFHTRHFKTSHFRYALEETSSWMLNFSFGGPHFQCRSLLSINMEDWVYPLLELRGETFCTISISHSCHPYM